MTPERVEELARQHGVEADRASLLAFVDALLAHHAQGADVLRPFKWWESCAKL